MADKGDRSQDGPIVELIRIGDGLEEVTTQPFYSLFELFKELEEIKKLDTVGSFKLNYL